MKINALLNNPLQDIGKTGSSAPTDTGFSQMLRDALKGTVDAQRTAEKMSVAAAVGQDVPMHEVIQAVSKAELTLQTMVSVRDKAVEAYQEILRMPI